MKKQMNVSELVHKAMLTGLGLASYTGDAIKKSAQELASRSNMSEEEGRRLLKDLQKRSMQAEKALEKKVESVVHDVLGRLNLQVIPKGAAKAAKASRKRAGKSSHHAGNS
jgi:polyhydroxyalkanoate synthesis regulator phasin